MRYTLTLIMSMLIPILGIGNACYAQFNPDNPIEPNLTYYYPLTTACSPKNVAYCSGDGRYEPGQTVWVHTSSYSENYVFSHWTLNGERIEAGQGFYFTTTTHNANLVAHYTFQPINPSDPYTVLSRRLYLESQPAGIASFSSTSGDRHPVDEWVGVCAYANQGYRFVGWYRGEQEVSQSQDFNFLMPDEDVRLTARFVFDPTSPKDPGMGAKGEYNFNARDYDVAGSRIPCTNGTEFVGHNLQLAGPNLPSYDAADKYLQFDGWCQGYLDAWSFESTESGQYFARSGQDDLTLIVKVAPRLDTGNAGDLISNRGDNHNYMLRVGQDNRVFLHTMNGDSSRGLTYTSEEPQIFAVRVNGAADCIFIDNLTTGESKEVGNVEWGYTGSVMKFFYNDGGEYFTGRFYWMYCSHEFLSDSEVRKVVDYNEVEPEPEHLLGDVNGDGVVDVSDAVQVINYYLSGEIDDKTLKLCDINGDGVIDVSDAVAIINIYLNN